MNVYLTMETSLSFGYCSVASNLGQFKEIEETFQLYRGGGSQSVLILEKQSATTFPRKCSATQPAGCEAHLTCGNCPMHCATVAYPKKSSIFDIFWDQINGKNCSVQQHVCQPEGLYSLGNFNVYMYVLTLESYSLNILFLYNLQSIFAYLLFYILLGIFCSYWDFTIAGEELQSFSNMCLVLRVNEQGRIFIVPHLLFLLSHPPLI